MLDLEIVLPFCANHNLTLEQFTLCHMIHMEKKNRHKTLRMYLKEFPFSKKTIEDLKRKGYLYECTLANKETFYSVTEKFLSAVYLEPTFAAEELFEIYPSIFYNDKRPITLKAINFDEFVKMYSRHIGNLIGTHRKILALVEKGKLLEFSFPRIDKFISGRVYNAIKEIDSTSNNIELG